MNSVGMIPAAPPSPGDIVVARTELRWLRVEGRLAVQVAEGGRGEIWQVVAAGRSVGAVSGLGMCMSQQHAIPPKTSDTAAQMIISANSW